MTVEKVCKNCICFGAEGAIPTVAPSLNRRLYGDATYTFPIGTGVFEE